MQSLALHIFTFHDHLFKIVLEDECGTTVELDSLDLKIVREKCASILQGYCEEMSMLGAKS